MFNKTKTQTIFDSLWFNVSMTILSIAMLSKYVIANYLSGNYYQNFILIIAWIVILFHFIIVTKRLVAKKTD